MRFVACHQHMNIVNQFTLCFPWALQSPNHQKALAWVGCVPTLVTINIEISHWVMLAIFEEKLPMINAVLNTACLNRATRRTLQSFQSFWTMLAAFMCYCQTESLALRSGQASSRIQITGPH